MTSDLPELATLVREGRLRGQPVDRAALEATLSAAEEDVAAAAAIAAQSPAWAEAMLYEAGLRAARVIVQSAGFRIAADRGHVTAIDAADALTGGAHHRRFTRLHRMRRVRHEFMYEIGRPPGESDLAQAREDIGVLLQAAGAALRAAP